MRLKISFKMHGADAELANKISSISGVDVNKLANVAFLQYLEHVVLAAEQRVKQMEKEKKQNEKVLDHVGGDTKEQPLALSSEA